MTKDLFTTEQDRTLAGEALPAPYNGIAEAENIVEEVARCAKGGGIVEMPHTLHTTRQRTLHKAGSATITVQGSGTALGALPRMPRPHDLSPSIILAQIEQRHWQAQKSLGLIQTI